MCQRTGILHITPVAHYTSACIKVFYCGHSLISILLLIVEMLEQEANMVGMKDKDIDKRVLNVIMKMGDQW